MTHIEAMKQALEALENLPALNWIPEKDRQVQEAITALRQAIATEESSATQELLKCKPYRSGKYLTIVYRDVDIGDEVLALTRHEKSCAMSWSNALWDVAYLKSITHPQPKAEQEPIIKSYPEKDNSKREWVGLTDEEVRQMCGSVPSMKDAVRQAEAKLKEKNT